MNSPVVIFTANRGYALTSSRTSLIQHFLDSGWQVVIASADDIESRTLCDLGAQLEPVIFHRGGIFLSKDVKAYYCLSKIYSKWNPTLIQHFHAKPVVFGSLAAKRTLGEKVRVVNTITGLGHAFVNNGIASRLAGLGYRVALPKVDMTIFQNRDDQTLFVENKWIDRYRNRLVGGSGVDTLRFSFVDRSLKDDSIPIIVMLSRLLRQKGIHEYIEVAKRIRQYYPKARFLLAGEEELSHPDAVSADWINSQGHVEFMGRLTDVAPTLNQADLFLFPSYYREGLPRVLLEASATGLPSVAFDVPGVREAVKSGRTGFLVPYKNIDSLNEKVNSLSEKVLFLLKEKAERLQMGKNARKMIENGFDIRTVEQQYLDIYNSLGICV